MPALPPTRRTILVVARGWPQQENPDLPLLPADAPAVLAGRVASAVADPPADPGVLAARLADAADSLRLPLPEAAVLQAVCAHALRAAGDVEGSLRLVAADLGRQTLVYALLTPIVVADPPASS